VSTDDAMTRLSIVLRPYRSANVRAINTVVLWVGGLSLFTGLGFFLAGAWPVVGFLGLDVLLLYGALRLSQGRGRTADSIDLTDDSLTISHTNHWGEQRTSSFQAHWLKVEIEEVPGRQDRLLLRFHGQALAIGGFLTAPERRDVAEKLRHALAGLGRPLAAPA
jgi:uncharacterized membrane protein